MYHIIVSSEYDFILTEAGWTHQLNLMNAKPIVHYSEEGARSVILAMSVQDQKKWHPMVLTMPGNCPTQGNLYNYFWTGIAMEGADLCHLLQ